MVCILESSWLSNCFGYFSKMSVFAKSSGDPDSRQINGNNFNNVVFRKYKISQPWLAGIVGFT
jgi:hypothetical protein